MTSTPSRLPFHYGWIIVLAGGLTLFSCLGLARFAFGMLLPGMRESLGLGYDQMGFISTANFAGYLVSVAVAPSLIKRFKPRLTMTFGLALVGVCMLAMGRCSSSGSLSFFYALIGVGSGLANIPAMVLVSHWFRKSRRGRAAGLMIMGNGSAIIFSGLFVPRLIESLGVHAWRTGWFILGGISLAIMGLVFRLVRNDPQELGLTPVGGEEVVSPILPGQAPADGAGKILIYLGVLYLLFGATYMVYGSFIVTAMVEEYGFSQSLAGQFWSWVGFFALFSGVAFGALSDRIGRKGGLAFVLATQTLAYGLAGVGLGREALIVSVVLYGLAVFAIPTIMAAAVGDYLGLSRAASGFSLVTFFFAAGQTVGPAAAGVLAEATGTFAGSFLLCAGLTSLGMFLACLLPRTKQ